MHYLCTISRLNCHQHICSRLGERSPIIKNSAGRHTTAVYFKEKVSGLWSLLPHYTGKDQKLSVFFRRPSLQLAQRLQMIHPIKEPIRYNEARGELSG